MKQVLSLLFFVIIASTATFCQNPDFNLTQVSQVVYPEGCNDIWGYVDDNGVEYAVLGTRTATVVLNLEDPANPQQIYRVDGSMTTWRDMKTWDNYIYSVCDNCPDGLVIIDMTDPVTPTHKIVLDIPDMVNGGTERLGAVHNIFIDEFGFLYLAGGDQINGGVVVIDVHTDPWNPAIVGYGPARYSHDVYVRNNLAYSADIYNGFFSVLDVTDKSDIQQLATQNTISLFTHNAWLSDDSNYLYTTDEVDFAYIESYDVSDLTDIKRVDIYRPPSTEHLGVTPHNVHVFNDYLVVSYYTDGIKIIDAQYPDNLIEVGSFDTYLTGSGGTNGLWGAYPFLPSGLVLISDMINGLYVLQPNYVRASYLQGKVTDAITDANITEVKIDILGTQPNIEQTNNFGTYKTGIADEGMIDVMFSHPSYRDTIVNVSLSSDSITILDVKMTPRNSYVVLTGKLTSADGVPLPNEDIYFDAQTASFSFTTDVAGDYSGFIFDGMVYEVSAGSWGFGDTLMTVADVSGGLVDITLPGKGRYYQDRFLTDQGWMVDNMAVTGDWERGTPVGSDFQGQLNPDGDSPFDVGDKCYGTGLEGNTPFDNDVDGVYNTLWSPEFFLHSEILGLTLSFDYWFRASDINGTPNDTLEVEVYLDGVLMGRVAALSESDVVWRSYTSENLLNAFPLVGNVQFAFIIGDPEDPAQSFGGGCGQYIY